MKQKIYTIGYTGFEISEFVLTLQKHAVECIIDIREIPLSRKKGFSKTALSNALESAGIEYRHFRSLGSPRNDRHELRETGDFSHFFNVMNEHLQNKNAHNDLLSSISIARRLRSCLMCCCPEWEFCHRKSVVEAIQNKTTFFYEHLSQSPNLITNRKAA